MLRCYPGVVVLIESFVGWVTMLVAATSKRVVLIVVLYDVSYLGMK